MTALARQSLFFAVMILCGFLGVRSLCADLVVPAGSTFNIGTGTFNVTGDVINEGEIQSSTGTLELTGNWDMSTGIYTPGTDGTLDFSGSMIQNFDSGGTTLQNLIHSGTGRLEVNNSGLAINGHFTHSAGIVDFNSNNVSLAGDWNNQVGFASILVTGSDVILNGDTQAIRGSTVFCGLEKEDDGTLILQANQEQIISSGCLLSLRGLGEGSELTLTSTNPGGGLANRHQINLQPGALQDLEFLNVTNSDATGLNLVGRNSLDTANTDSAEVNPKWYFGGAGLIWTGTVSTRWDVPGNWDLGIVPGADDSVVIPDVSGVSGNFPTLALIAGAGITISNLTVETGAEFRMAGKNVSVTEDLDNNGLIYAFGHETFALSGANDTTAGTWVFTGDTDNFNEDFFFTNTFPVEYFNLVFNDPVPSDNFITDSNLTVHGDLTITSGSFDISTNGNSVSVAGDLVVNGAVVLGAGGSLDVDGDFELSGGSFAAPSSVQSFNVGGDFVQSAGSFAHSSGTVVLDGADQLISANGTVFNNLNKTGSTDTLTFDHAVAQGSAPQIVGQLTLSGLNALNPLTINSTQPGTEAFLDLRPGANQDLKYLSVRDSNAQSQMDSLTLVGRQSSEPAVNPNNTNWFFGSVMLTWQGGFVGNPTDWNSPQNWDVGMVPFVGDTVMIPDTANDPVLATAVDIDNLTIQAGAVVNLDGKNLKVDSAFSNEGLLRLQGAEIVNLTQDTDSGTWEYIGNNTGVPISIYDFGGVDYFNLVINDNVAVADLFITTATLTVDNDLTVTAGTLSPAVNARDLVVGNNVTINGGGLNVANGDFDLEDSLVISSGTFTAPGAAYAFTVGGSWTNSGGTFDANGGTITFDGATTAVISGDNDFSSIVSSVGGKVFQFAAGDTQTISGSMVFTGVTGSEIVLESTVTGVQWNLVSNNGSQGGLQFLAIQDSEITGADGDDFFCFFCVNNGGNDNLDDSPHWVFSLLSITVPESGNTVDQTPTIIGISNPGDVVDIYARRASDGVWVVVANVVTDANGNWRVEVDAGADTLLQTGANELQPSVGGVFGVVININVVATPTSDQQPTIDSPADGAPINSALPMISGQGQAGSTVTILASDANGNLLLQSVGAGVVDGNGDYAITLTTPLVGGENILSVTVNGVASDLVSVLVSNPYGIVFESFSNQPIKNAVVSLLRASDQQLAQPGIDLPAAAVNPFTTQADGAYGFAANSGSYYIQIVAEGYEYPSEVTTFPMDKTIVTGSKGEVFVVSPVITQIDQPMDGGAGLIRIVKTANKSRARVGEVVTYTVQMENLNLDNVAEDLTLRDKIPAGFKYLSGRVTLDGIPVADPAGGRTLIFPIGDLAPAATRELKYQLVIGSGVSAGSYRNEAVVVNSGNLVVSNLATEEVDITVDPLFDMGTVIGKVFHDVNENGLQDPPEYVHMDRAEIIEAPLPNVRIALADGTQLTTDENGAFNIPGLTPGRHLLRIDERSLPEGAYLTTDKAVIIDVTPGLMVKVNFGVNFDYGRLDSQDEMFFAKNVTVNLDDGRPQPRLNVQMFEDDILALNGHFIENVQFRIFLNYASFVDLWRLEIFDVDTSRVARKFEGNRYNILDPILWDGRMDTGDHINVSRTYQYRLFVQDSKNNFDETIAKEIVILDFEDEKDLEDYLDENNRTTKNYQDWIREQDKINSLQVQNILIQGETLRIRQVAADLRRVQVMKDGDLVIEVPITPEMKVTARDVLEDRAQDEGEEMDVILPNGNYEILVQESRTGESGEPGVPVIPAGQITMSAPVEGAKEVVSGGVNTYSKNIHVGEDYLFFVGLGDAKAGYNFNRGDMAPVAENDQFQKGFWKEDKATYFLKGKILGKFLVTSSYDSEREQKEIFRKLDPDQYYPIYGDESTINYDATDTQGRLFLLVEWDKSSARWSNYNINFGDTDFARYSRSLFGGKLDYQSIDSTKFGDARQHAIVFNARANQKSAHNEFLATGGSIYYLKHDNVLQGSDKIKVEVRDQVTGLVVSSRDLVEGADYEMDYANGRLIFWQPIPMLVETLSIISSNLLSGNPVYVVADYEYEIQDDFAQSSYGARVQQAVTDNLLIGSTYVRDGQEADDFQLQGTDVTLKLAKDATITAEIAQTQSDAERAFLSTDGGISFADLTTADDVQGRAYGIKGDFKLFNRLGLKSYYKWIENDFSTSATTAQQGKEYIGFESVYDWTDNTRFTARHDIQELISGGTMQTRLQLGAVQTTTSMMQIMHQAHQLRLTAEYQRTEVEERLDAFDNRNNTASDIVALQAEYDINEKLTVTGTQQLSLTDDDKTQTRVGVTARPVEGVRLTAEQALGSEGSATALEARADVTERLELIGGYTVESLDDGSRKALGTVGADLDINDQIKLRTTLGSDGENTTLVKAGGSGKVGDTGIVDAQVESTNSLDGTTTAMSLGGKQKVDEAKTQEGKITVTETPTGTQSTEFTFGTTEKMTDELEFVSSQTFGALPEGADEQEQKYALVRNKDGKRLEGSYARALTNTDEEFSRSNIFALSGDVDDKWAMTAQYERAGVDNIDGSHLTRQVASLGVGYRNEDKETGEDLKASTKLEYGTDDGSTDRRQYLIYQAIEGKINPEITLFAKVEFSSTRNLTDEMTEARHREIQFGGAYRPIYHDRLNLISKYTFAENRSPLGQETLATDVEQTRMQVLALDAIYELSQDWQLVEKLAVRVLDEKVAGFPFNRTHTWLMVHRLNYRVNKDWTLGAEYRQLTQREAGDAKRGMLIEAARSMGEFAEMGVGYNFTDFSDDLTQLDYRSQGPFVRLTGKIYDRTPAEIERSQKRVLDQKVTRWAWMMVEQELTRDDSPILVELNDYYVLAQLAYDHGDVEESRQIYKDIIVAGQMMLEDARYYIYSRIDREDDLRRRRQLADEYIKNKQFEEARKILEKIIEDAQSGMLE